MAVKKEGAIHRYVGLASDVKPTGTAVPIGSTFLEFDTNDTYITPDNTNWYVKDSKSIKTASVLVSVSAATAYASGDVLSNSASVNLATVWTLPDVAGYPGGSGQILQLDIESNANVCSLDPVLYFFTASAPNSVKTDNVAGNAPTHPDVSAGVYIGSILMPKLSQIGASADSTARSAVSTMPFSYKTGSTDDIYFIMQTATAATFASTEIHVKAWFKRS